MAEEKKSSVFDSVEKFFGVKSDKKAPKSKTQAEKDDDVRYRNKFRDGPNDKPAKKKAKKDKTSAGKKLKAAASTGLAAKLRDKSKKEIDKQTK